MNELEYTNLEGCTINDVDKITAAISFKIKMHCISLFTASRASKLLNKRFGGRGDLSKNENVLPETTLFSVSLVRNLISLMLTKNKPVSILKILFPAFTGVVLGVGCTNHNLKSENQKTSTMENTNGTSITLHGQTIHTVGKLPAVGTQLNDFTLTDTTLSEKSLADFKGKYVIMNIFPSVNTGVCAKSVREFNKDAAALNNTVVLCISKDLPFAQKAFCGAEGIDNVVMLSDFRNDFGHTYGVLIADGPMKGLLSRAVIVANPEGKIVYEQQVPEIGQEPDYSGALAAVK